METRWSTEKAWAWYAKQGWVVGCNFTPSSAINQLEMWQADTFDLACIDRELGWAAAIGFNAVRVYLHDLLWESDVAGFRQRIEGYLTIADAYKIKTIFVFFDDCWNPEPHGGIQPAPKPGVHNSGWVQSPGAAVVNDPAQWPRLEKYVTGVISAYRADERILLWDLYNEPGNVNQNERSLPLLKETFEWARSAAPSQPLTVGIFYDNAKLNEFQLAASDIITFHNYNSADNLKAQITGLKEHGRPLICTEYMARRQESLFQTCLPVFKTENVGCLSWGLVAGKTQTIYPWGSPEGAPEPARWFHDMFRPDGSPFDKTEIEAIEKATGVR
jgi:hypothetical protein